MQKPQVQEAKNYVNSYLNKSETNIFSKMDINWENGKLVELAKERVLEVSLINTDRIFQTSSLINKVTDQEQRSNIRLIVLRDKLTDKVTNAVYMSIINDGTIMDLTKVQYKNANKLTGKILFYDLSGQFINGWHYTNGVIDQTISKSTVEAYKLSSTSKQQVGLQKLSSLRNDTKVSYIALPDYDCYDELVPTYGVSCVGVDGYMNCSLYQNGSTYVTHCEYNGGGGGNEGGGITPGHGGGGNGGNVSSGTNTLPNDPYLPGQDHSPVDIKKFIKCFDNIPNSGATYKVIVQVLEPVPGTSLNYGLVNGVGHTAITLIKQGSNGLKVTQTVGFYPSSNPFSSPSKMVNNSDETDYTIRMVFDMGGNSTDFNKILNGIANPPSQYTLLGMNCTAFVSNVCSLGGLSTPSPITTVGVTPPITMGAGPVFAMTPGGLGYSMRAAQTNGDSRISSGPTSTSNNPVSNGPCN